AESSVERLSFLFLRFKKNPVPKGAGFFRCVGYISPVALRLPGLRIRTRPARPVARTGTPHHYR
ncbi:TPA: hypothetical protein ACGPDY_005060, partial [Klebsiella variicola]